MSDVYPIISVIIPCYNCEKDISIALDSLLNQTYKNFEVICINDGSIDRTEEVINNWVSNHCLTVSVISQSNGGVSSARNLGIANSKGRYICFLDADDQYHPKFLELLLHAMKSTKSDISYCRLSRNEEDVFGFKNKKDSIIQTQEEAMRNLLYKMWDYGFYCYMYKKDVILKSKLEFDIDTKYGEDREFIWKYLSWCSSAVWIDQPLYYYRESSGSVTQKKASWRNTDAIKAIQRADMYLKKMNCVYYKQFHEYMNARVMWAVAKSFAISGDKNLFEKLGKKYNVYEMMKITLKDKVKLVKVASFLYIINPILFFYVLFFYGKIKELLIKRLRKVNILYFK